MAKSNELAIQGRRWTGRAASNLLGTQSAPAGNQLPQYPSTQQYYPQPNYYEPQYAPQYAQQPIYYEPQYAPPPAYFNLGSYLNSITPGVGDLFSGGAATGGTFQYGNGYSEYSLNLSIGGLTQATVLPGLSLVTPNEESWFKFTITQDGQAGQFASVTFDDKQSHLQIALYASGNTTDPIEQGVADGDVNQINLQGLAAGTYYIEVSGDKPIADYDLEVDANIAPPAATSPTPDWAQPNSQSAPYDMRSISGSQTFTGLSINTPDLPDWFEFQTDRPGRGRR